MRARTVLLTAVVLAAGLSAAPGPAEPSAQTREQALVGQNARRLPDGQYRLDLPDGLTLFTHGPDPEPTHGGGIGPGDPERTPLCGTDYHQHVLYGRPNTTADRFATVKPVIVSAIRRMNAILNEDAIASGQRNADYKVKCDLNGDMEIGRFFAGGSSYESIVSGARGAGFNKSNADYTIFYDSAPAGYCGLASRFEDDSAGASNANNNGGGYAVIYNNCWTNEAPMHENGHNQGAVASGAPYSTQAGHCYDENDVMCYADGGPLGDDTINRCTDAIHFDCGYDSYFDAQTESGEWLSSHWNIGSSANRFVILRNVSRPPVTGFSASCSGLACSFTDLSTDEGAVTGWAWDFGAGSTSTQANPLHTFASPGTFVVTLTATDDQAMSSSSVLTLTVPNTGDPDPSAGSLSNGTAASAASPAHGQWRYHKVFVPAGRGTMTVTITADACDLIVCDPDLDVFVRQGQRPDRNNAACSSQSLSNTESCTIKLPAPGYWYIGVYAALSTSVTALVDPLNVPYTVTARF